MSVLTSSTASIAVASTLRHYQLLQDQGRRQAKWGENHEAESGKILLCFTSKAWAALSTYGGETRRGV